MADELKFGIEMISPRFLGDSQVSPPRDAKEKSPEPQLRGYRSYGWSPRVLAYELLLCGLMRMLIIAYDFADFSGCCAIVIDYGPRRDHLADLDESGLRGRKAFGKNYGVGLFRRVIHICDYCFLVKRGVGQYYPDEDPGEPEVDWKLQEPVVLCPAPGRDARGERDDQADDEDERMSYHAKIDFQKSHASGICAMVERMNIRARISMCILLAALPRDVNLVVVAAFACARPRRP